MKKVLGTIILFGLIGLLIATASGGAGAPGGGPPGGGGPGGGPGGSGGGAGGGTTEGGGPNPIPGNPFNFSGVVKLVNIEGQYFLLVDGPVRNPKDLETGSIELINLKPFEYEGKMLYPVILKSTPSGIQEVSLEEIQPYQSVSAGGIVKGAAEGNPQWELNAARVHIVQEDYLEYQEKTYGRGIVAITTVNGEWITITDNQVIKVMPDCQITTYDKNGREIPFIGQLTPNTRVTIQISSRPDRNYKYTNRIYVH